MKGEEEGAPNVNVLPKTLLLELGSGEAGGKYGFVFNTSVEGVGKLKTGLVVVLGSGLSYYH